MNKAKASANYKTTKMTKEQYSKEVIKYRGPDLINFYYRMADKYGVYARKPKAIPSFLPHLYD